MRLGMSRNAVRLTLWTLLLAVSAQAQWQQLGLEDHDITDIQYHDSFLYAATDTGVYRLDLGTAPSSWESLGLKDLSLSDILVISADTIYAGLSSGSVAIYRTTNGGSSWQDFHNNYGGGGPYPVFCFDYAPANPGTIWATGYTTVARSTDWGEHWVEVFPGIGWNTMGVATWFVHVDRSTPSIIWSGGESVIFAPVLVKSTDGGDYWFGAPIPSTGDNAVHQIAIHPFDSDTAWVACEGFVYKTGDGGSSWDNVLLTTMYNYAIQIDRTRPNLLYMSGGQHGTPLTLYLTRDGGSTWQTVKNLDHQENWAYDMVVVSYPDSNVIFLATTYGIYRYLDSFGYLCGDSDRNDVLNIADAVFIIGYIFGGGPVPDPLEAGDVDCNDIVNIADAVYLISYIFGGGPVPCAACP